MERAYLGEQNGLGVKQGTDEFVERLRVEVVERIESVIRSSCTQAHSSQSAFSDHLSQKPYLLIEFLP
jgi:hypothetical protein